MISGAEQLDGSACPYKGKRRGEGEASSLHAVTVSHARTATVLTMNACGNVNSVSSPNKSKQSQCLQASDKRVTRFSYSVRV